MALTQPDATRNAGCNAKVDLIDADASAGKMKIFTSGDSLLVTLTFSATAFGNAVAGVATANAITNGTGTASGTAAKMSFTDGANVVIYSGLTVGLSNSDLILDSLVITSGVTVVAVSAFTLTEPAS